MNPASCGEIQPGDGEDMDTPTLEKLLDNYEHLLLNSSFPAAALSQLSSEARAEMESFLRLTWLLQQSFTPVSPAQGFRSELRRSLLAAALQRETRSDALVTQLRRHWKLTAAAATASGVSVAVGAISAVVLYRSRSQP
jgi:hypothetical protein